MWAMIRVSGATRECRVQNVLVRMSLISLFFSGTDEKLSYNLKTQGIVKWRDGSFWIKLETAVIWAG